MAFVSTHEFVRRPEDFPNPGHGHHEFGNAETGRRALRFLEARLFDIGAVVPAGPLERLQRVVLVLDLSHGELTAMAYLLASGRVSG